MRVLIIGPLGAELGQAARLALARGAKLAQADDITPALDTLRADGGIDLVLCDLRRDIAGLLGAMAQERIAVPVVACGVNADAEAAVRAIRAGAREFLPLPPDAEVIAALLASVSDDASELIVGDPRMQATVRRAEQVAGAEASVLITGESGTGKEVLARHIHRRSRRAAGPFVALNCAAIPEALLESELFGHEKGAFSGALARRVGKFEAADGGTLLLDEIGEMDLRLQAKLLRALQEREIDRVGGARPVRVNVRILATTNRNLAAEAARGRFREDLYFRLNVVSLRIPPLRERRGDIAPLGAGLRPALRRRERPARAPLRAGRAATAHGAFLARQCARTGKHRASRGAPRQRRRHWRRRHRTRRRACISSRVRCAPRRGRGRAGRAQHGRGRARPDPANPASHRRQSHACRRHPRHLHPCTAQQAARLCVRGCRCAAARARRERLMQATLAAMLPVWSARLRAYAPGTDVGLALGVVALLSVLILPLPPFVLDLGLSLSVTSAVLVLMVALFLRRPLDFSSFPTLLLLTTLLRLSLNVATTRLILSRGNEGPTAAGHVVAAFGGFLMGGDVVIGLILFAILLVVNFMVITKGSGRIAEVAARFTLDAMPGKQMAIDAELSSGAIDEKTARRRRRELEQESGFYGAMDGAAKFVRGDAIAALHHHQRQHRGRARDRADPPWHAVRRGRRHLHHAHRGRRAGEPDPGAARLHRRRHRGDQGRHGGAGGCRRCCASSARSPKPLALAAAAAGVLAVMPGLPAVPFLALAGLAGGGAWLRHKSPPPAPDAPPPLPANREPPISDALRMDMIRLELGYGLLALAGGDAPRLTEQIKGLRRSIAAEMGFVLPPVRIQDNMQLAADAYSIRVKEIEAGGGEMRPTKLLAMDPAGGVPDLPGERTQEPAFGLPALWIDPSVREQATVRGCTVVDPPSVLTTHLTEIVKQSMAELLSFAETQKLLDELPREHQKLVAELIPTQISVGGVQRVLQALLAERVSIRDLPTMLEGIQEACAAQARAMPAIVLHVRARLARQISESACRRRRLHPAGHALAGVGGGVRRCAGRPGRGSAARDGALQAGRVHAAAAHRVRHRGGGRRDGGAAHQRADPLPRARDRRAHPADDARSWRRPKSRRARASARSGRSAMRLKLYRAATAALAMGRVRAELGPEALILATRRVGDGVEVTAALEPDPPPAPRRGNEPARCAGRSRGMACRRGCRRGCGGADLAGALAGALRFEPLPMPSASRCCSWVRRARARPSPSPGSPRGW